MAVQPDRDDDVYDESRSEDSGSGPVIAWVLGVIAVIALAVLAAFAFGAFDDDTELGETDDVDIADLGISAADVQEDPEQYVGQSVTVRGAVDEILGPQSFTLGDHDLLGDSLLIVSVEPIPIPAGVEREETISPDDVVQVTGTVHMFEDGLLEVIGEDYGFLFEEEPFVAYEGEPVILLDSIDLAPESP